MRLFRPNRGHMARAVHSEGKYGAPVGYPDSLHPGRECVVIPEMRAAADQEAFFDSHVVNRPFRVGRRF